MQKGKAKKTPARMLLWKGNGSRTYSTPDPVEFRGLIHNRWRMSGMRPEYREAIENTLRTFVQSGDDCMCIAVFCIQDRVCQVCGHHPITWNYLVENLGTHEILIAGSECI